MEDFNIDEILNNELNEGIEDKIDKSDVVSSNKEVIKKPISVGKIIVCILLGIIFSLIIFILVGSLYTKYIRYPAQEEVDFKSTGAYAINQYEEVVHKQESITDKDYLVKEKIYANSNPDKLAFIKKIVNTVHYEPNIVNAKNIYGNDMIDKDTNEVVKISSYVNDENEEVNLSYIDYDSITFDSDKLDDLILRYDLSKDNVDYSNILVDMFCEYICSIKEIPLKTEPRVVAMKDLGSSYAVLADEDIYLDKLLFSSDSLKNCEKRFTEEVGFKVTGDKLEESKEWVEWNKLSDAKKSITAEPLMYGKLSMSNNWCGSYYLQNEYYFVDEDGDKVKKELQPQLGDGTIESPSSIGTSVITYVLKENKDGTYRKLPIRVELSEFGVSEKAIKWFESKHIQNRGFNIESEVQYCYCVFTVTNLSNEKLVISDNSSLCDKSGNLSSRTGTIYGLQSEVSLNPDETGVIESWGRSTELNKKYLIWGADFNKQINPVWFRVLAGDLEDKSEDKGVHIISRDKKENKVSDDVSEDVSSNVD